ncbi:MAG: hypothetical protein HYZ57_09105 [Acidobacteria bacterium]|nr:hypothetical protein [Acidobacteriota bacterium]MBI3279983.1 hypothetical protein [Acidobacteriota bacterium]
MRPSGRDSIRKRRATARLPGAPGAAPSGRAAKPPLRALLASAFDYAGIFPPAALDLAAAARKYASYLAGPHAWMLGRFVVPAARLSALQPPEGGFRGWRISALAGSDLAADLHSILEFEDRHGECVDSIELKAAGTHQIREASDRISSGMRVYFEAPPSRPDLVQAIGQAGRSAKIRTGGVTPEAFPSSGALADFMEACVSALVPFKATAGLHHAIRSEQPLTFEPLGPRGVMHGFINVLAAAAFLRHGLTTREITCVLEEQSPEAFHFDEHGLAWRDHRLRNEQLLDTRDRFFASIGSCSFEEPVQDLEALGLL